MSLAPLPPATASALPVVEELTPAPDPWAVAPPRPPPAPALPRQRRPPPGPRAVLVRHRRPGRVAGRIHPPSEVPDPFAELARRLAAFPVPTLPGLPPFQGGVAGLFGYGLQHAIERIPRPRFDEFGVPDLAVGVYDWVIAWDHATGRAWLISTGYPEQDRRRAGRGQ